MSATLLHSLRNKHLRSVTPDRGGGPRARRARSSLAFVSDDLRNIEKDIEATRERLAQTIDQLVYRSSPKTIASRQVAATKAYFVDPASGAPRTDNILKVVGGVVGVAAVFVLLRKTIK